MFLPMLISILAATQPVTFPDVAEPLNDTKVRLNRAFTRLTSPPLDDVDFVLSDLDFRLKRRFTEYSGDISGRLIGALYADGRMLNKPSPTLTKFLKALPELQKSDGHFGADQDLAKSIDQKRDMPILWGNSRMLLALAEISRDKKMPQLVDMARRLGDYIVNSRQYYGNPDNYKKVGGEMASGFTTCYPALIDGMVAVGVATGDQKYLEEAKYIAGLSLIDKEFAKHHSHGRLTAYRGILDLNSVMPVPDLVNGVIEGCKKIEEQYVLPTGGVQEMFDATYNRDEGCSEADWLRVNVLLWKTTGELHYLDAAEHVMRNHLYAAQFFNGGFGHGFLRVVKRGDEEYPFAGFGAAASESYWCCSMHGAQVLADIARWAIATDESGAVYVTWLGESSAEFSGVKVRVEKKKYDTWTVGVETAPDKTVAVRLRVPGWTDAIIVDGRQMPATNGWAEISASGKKSFNVSLPRKVRFAGMRTAKVQEGQPVRIFAGPDLYALPDNGVPAGTLADDAVPNIILSEAQSPSGEIPAIIEGTNGQQQTVILVPINARSTYGCRVFFDARMVSVDEFGAMASKAASPPTPPQVAHLCFAAAGQYDVYMNGQKLFSGGGWEESPFIDAPVKPGLNTVSVIATNKEAKSGCIGQIRFGKVWGTNAVWNAIPIDKEPTPDMLTSDTPLPTDGAVIEEMGPFGTPPWNYFPAQFAGTDAKWIWPKDIPADGKCLFRFQFNN